MWYNVDVMGNRGRVAGGVTPTGGSGAVMDGAVVRLTQLSQMGSFYRGEHL